MRWTSVDQFNAVADGVTDAASAFTQAFAASNFVFVPPGVYAIGSRILLPNGAVLWAMPGTVTLRATAGNTTNPVLLSVSNSANGAAIHGITFDGNRLNIGTFNTVCQVFNSSRVVFRNCRWTETRGIGVLFSTSVSLSGVENCHFNEVGTYSKVTGLDADRRAAISFCCGTRANNFGNFVRGCQFNEAGLDSISFSNQSSGVIVGNITQTTYASGGVAYVSNSLDVTVSGNTGRGCGGNGIDIYQSSGVTVAGNMLAEGAAAGIMVAESSNVTVTGNTCLDNDVGNTSLHAGGIALDGTAGAVSNVVIVGNVSRDTRAGGSKTQRHGFYVRPTSTVSGIWLDRSNDLTGNQIADIGGTPLLAVSTDPPLWAPASSVSLSVNGQMALEATSNTTATLRYRGSDGVTRSAAIALT